MWIRSETFYRIRFRILGIVPARAQDCCDCSRIGQRCHKVVTYLNGAFAM